MVHRKQYGSTTFIFIYGNPGELHETAILNASGNCDVLEGAINKCVEQDSSIIVNYFTTGQNVVSIGSDIVLYLLGIASPTHPFITQTNPLLDRPTAYQYWFPDLSTTDVFQTVNTDSPAVKGPYLVRSASLSGDTLSLTGDLNATVNVEFLAPPSVTNFEWNGASVATRKTTQGSYTGTLQFTAPNITILNLANLDWVCSHEVVMNLAMLTCGIYSRNLQIAFQRYKTRTAMLFGPMPATRLL